MSHDIESLKKIYSRNAQFDVNVDLSGLDAKRKEIVKRLIKATDIIDDIYWKQDSHDALKWRAKYKHPKNEEERLIHDLIEMNCGPYDRLNFRAPFVGDRKREPGGGFFPQDITLEEFETYVKNHPDKKKLFESEFTVIKRNGSGLEAVWYHDEYSKEISEIVRLLRECAELADDRSFKDYLIKKSDDLLTDRYFNSDCAWIDLKDEYLDFVIGPYEVYADNLMGVKTGYESVVMLINKEETKKVQKYIGLLNDFEKSLPIDSKYKSNEEIKLDSPMEVVDSIYRGGEARRVMQFVAFNLPNDPQVQAQKGSKKVMHKNFMEARFNKIVRPIAESVIHPDLHKYLHADSYFSFVILHEISHALGPKYKYGTKDPINGYLKDYYSPTEELRANLLSMFCHSHMARTGNLSEEAKKCAYLSFLGGELRTVRLGNRAYTNGAIITYNYMLEKGGVVWKNGKINVDFEKFEKLIDELAKEVSHIEVEGDYDAAKALHEKYNLRSELINNIMNAGTDLPIDIWPNYVNV